ncbi:MAG: M14 family zinc carboxypeptidase [Salinibacter sp.]|uniref:M14 family zinc carboxypeptidase n=1 Tax=Salinibacter sp. TaxID=2065818 RepID=UPI0035D483AB
MILIARALRISSRALGLAVFAAALGATAATAQVPTPESVIGFKPGADRKLADYEQLRDYYSQLANASDRVRMETIGTTSMGRPMKLLFISSTDNLDNLERWQEISSALARARPAEKKARRLADEGKAVVWIDAGMHATEMAPGQAMMTLAHRVATEESAEMQKIRENVVLLLMPMMNPDGLEIVENWYDRVLNTPYETTSPPWLYQKYVGHDNNRDWFMNNMPETQAVTDVIYNEWYPQIVVNHHQTSPSWARIFVPPFSGPVNPNIHPAVVSGVNQVGTAMTHRFAMNDMPGVISNDTFTMFWNGGMRTAPYFHNQIGILTEVAHATPTPRYYAPDSLPSHVGYGNPQPTDGTGLFYPDPWKGGESHFSDAVRYTNTASMAVLDLAADRPTQFLFNMYKMGRDAIEAGKSGNPYAYVIPPEQWHPREAHNLVNILRQGGVEVDRATSSFEAGGKTYPSGSFVVPASQAFRPFVMDMLEPQNYPTRRTATGKPETPYDLAGWTLPMQMGVTVDRINEPFEVQATAVTDSVAPDPAPVRGNAGYGYALSHRPNTSIEAVNELLADGETVYWTEDGLSVRGTTLGNGAIVIERQEGTAARMKKIAEKYGLPVHGLSSKPNGPLHQLQPPRVGIYKSWVPSIDEGWTRWVLKEYDVPVDTLHDADVRTDDLSKYTTIILPHHYSNDVLLNGHEEGTMPEPYVGGLGLEGATALEQYVEEGGTVVAFDQASNFTIDQFGLPVKDVTEDLSDGEFFIPGSLIRATVNTEHPLAYGMQDTVAASFSQSRAFKAVRQDKMGEGGREDTELPEPPPVEVVARYAEKDLLMSGWALGEKEHIGGEAALMRVRHGEGSVVLFGFRPQFRGQPRGTYKLVFNALHAATIEEIPRVGQVSADPFADRE